MGERWTLFLCTWMNYTVCAVSVVFSLAYLNVLLIITYFLHRSGPCVRVRTHTGRQHSCRRCGTGGCCHTRLWPLRSAHLQYAGTRRPWVGELDTHGYSSQLHCVLTHLQIHPYRGTGTHTPPSTCSGHRLSRAGGRTGCYPYTCGSACFH